MKIVDHYTKFVHPDAANQLRKLGVKLNKHTLFSKILTVGNDHNFEPEKKPKSTDAAPGSLEKLEVFVQRLLHGQELYHEDDAPVLATIEQSNEMRSLVISNDKQRRLASKAKRAKQSA